MTDRIRVLLADDQPLILAGLRMVLDAMPDLEVVGEVHDGRAALYRASSLAAERGVDVVVMDVRMPRLDGIEATRQLLAARPEVRVLVLTTYDEDDAAVAAIEAGASGFLLKDAPAEELVGAIRAVAAGDAVLAPSTTRRLLDRLARSGTASRNRVLDRLSDREHEVLLELATGATNAEIAERLFVSPTTVKTHVAHILAKLEVRDRIAAAVLAHESGIVPPRSHGRQP